MRAITQILTIGHSTHTLERFAELLRGASVEVLVDVRTVPRSRRMPWFSGDSFADQLSWFGIEYVHEKRLGGFRKPVPGTPNTGWDSEAFRGYADHMASESFAAGLGRVIELASSRRVALMCAEAKWTQCHRQLTSDALVVAGWDVLHVGPDGSFAPHSLTAFAVVDGAAITYPAQQHSFDV